MVQQVDDYLLSGNVGLFARFGVFISFWALIKLQLLPDHLIYESAGEHGMSTLEPKGQSILSQLVVVFAEPVQLHTIEAKWELFNKSII